jgi:molybdopterin molybdotransferase
MAENVLSFEDALAVVLAEAGGLAVGGDGEIVGLLEARGRVLAERVAADRDQPPFDRSTRDGYAVRAGDVAAGREMRVVGSVRAGDVAAGREMRVVGSVRAGERWQGEAVGEGEAVEIMTGAPLPDGADAVVMVEHVAVVEDALEVGRTLRAGENVVACGAEARSGDTLLPVGRLMEAAEIAVAASCGVARVKVFARPRVAIVATGDELVELDAEPREWEIRNSNSYALAALVEAEGGAALRLPIARDTVEDLRARIAEGCEADLLLLSGGVSAGKFDLVEQVLAEAGAEFFFTGALIQPGRPIVLGRLPCGDGQWRYFFGLPGNPVSTQVCFHLFVASMLKALAGWTEVAPRFVEARLSEDVKGGARVTRFLPAELVSAWDGVSVGVVGWQGSGDVAANARGNCYAVLPAGVEGFAKGETVRVLLR